MEALAVTYRPKEFSDVVGQDNVISILKNQIDSKEIRQSYLFTGGAGTGKTTIARIFAREINTIQGDKYTTITCPKCRMARKITSYDVDDSGESTRYTCKCGHVLMEDEVEFEDGTDYQIGEVIEIDAASNNGVDDIRTLRDTCKTRPVNGGKKVYIIDEVHMLSTGAFNALLKTLEEPPEHVVIIMCTTDPQKIPATILSRLQRFDFKRISTQQIIERLEFIIEHENKFRDEGGMISVHADGLEFIAKIADGGMRDSISLLDTCLGYSNVLTPEDVGTILGRANYTEYLLLLKALSERNGSQIVKVVESLHKNGKDLKLFLRTFAEFLVEIRKFYVMKDPEYCNVPAYVLGQVEKVTQVIPYENLSYYFDSVIKIYNTIKYENQPKTLIEGELMSL